MYSKLHKSLKSFEIIVDIMLVLEGKAEELICELTDLGCSAAHQPGCTPTSVSWEGSH
jgi:hypothetical protein